MAKASGNSRRRRKQQRVKAVKERRAAAKRKEKRQRAAGSLVKNAPGGNGYQLTSDSLRTAELLRRPAFEEKIQEEISEDLVESERDQDLSVFRQAGH